MCALEPFFVIIIVFPSLSLAETWTGASRQADRGQLLRTHATTGGHIRDLLALSGTGSPLCPGFRKLHHCPVHLQTQHGGRVLPAHLLGNGSSSGVCF